MYFVYLNNFYIRNYFNYIAKWQKRILKQSSSAVWHKLVSLNIEPLEDFFLTVDKTKKKGEERQISRWQLISLNLVVRQEESNEGGKKHAPVKAGEGWAGRDD